MEKSSDGWFGGNWAFILFLVLILLFFGDN